MKLLKDIGFRICLTKDFKKWIIKTETNDSKNILNQFLKAILLDHQRIQKVAITFIQIYKGAEVFDDPFFDYIG